MKVHIQRSRDTNEDKMQGKESLHGKDNQFKL
jgi:hypothetical protein